jgi:hypothetical protein
VLEGIDLELIKWSFLENCLLFNYFFQFLIILDLISYDIINCWSIHKTVKKTFFYAFDIFHIFNMIVATHFMANWKLTCLSVFQSVLLKKSSRTIQKVPACQKSNTTSEATFIYVPKSIFLTSQHISWSLKITSNCN